MCVRGKDRQTSVPLGLEEMIDVHADSFHMGEGTELKKLHVPSDFYFCTRLQRLEMK